MTMQTTNRRSALDACRFAELHNFTSDFAGILIVLLYYILALATIPSLPVSPSDQNADPKNCPCCMLRSDKMSAEQQYPGSALTGGLEGRNILPRVQDYATFTALSHSIPAPNSARRLRACVACKESKVRCNRDEERLDDGCERCVKARRQCIVSASARNKRPRRNISNVASLESKVDALVAALKEKQAGDGEEHRVGSPADPASGQTNALSKDYNYGP